MLLTSLLVAAPANAQESSEWIVVMVDDANPRAEARGVASSARADLTHIFDEVLGGFAVEASALQAQALARNPRVAAVVPSQTFSLVDVAGWGIFRIDADHAHEAGNGDHRGAGTRIIVIDSGIDRDHPDLEGNLEDISYPIVDPALDRNCIDPMQPPDDTLALGHGTHVAGAAAAAYGPNGFGVVGVAPEAEIVAIKAFDATGNATTAQVLCGLDIAMNIAMDGVPTVVNMSFGETGADSVCDDAGTDVIHEAVCDLASTGAILVAAAGNSATNTATFIPAVFDEVIAVSAYSDLDGIPGALAGCRFGPDFIYDCDDTFADFSNWGPDVDVMAPGVHIYSTLPDDTHGTKSGTSMASPHVAGVVALMLEADPSLTKAEAEALLQDTGECPDPVAAVNVGGPDCEDQGAWEGDPDSEAEPMVNALRAAQRAADEVRWISPRPGPADGAPFTVAIKVIEPVAGSSTVTWDVDGGPANPASYNATTGYYEALWDASALFPGPYTLTAHADDGGAATTDAIVVTLRPPQEAHWPLDDAAGTVAGDVTGFGWDGSLVNGPVWTGGLFDGALELDGDDDYLGLPADLADGTSDVTTTSWVRLDGAGSHAIFSGANSGNSNEFLLFLLSGTEMRFYTGEAVSAFVSWNLPTVADGAWHHLALVRDAANDEAQLYFDGVAQGLRPTALSELSIAPGGFLIGQEQDSVGGGFDPGQALDGLIDETYFYDRVLSAAEIAALATRPGDETPPSAVGSLAASAIGLTVDLSWTAATDLESGIASYKIYRDTVSGGVKPLLAEIPGSELAYVDSATVIDTTYYYEVTAVNGDGLEGPSASEVMATTSEPPDPTLFGYWALDEGSGTVAADGSANGYDGTLLGSPDWIPGISATALSFGPSTDRVDLPAAALDGANDLSIALWVKPEANGSHAIVSAANSGNSNELLMFILGTTQFRFYTGAASSSNVSWAIPSLVDGLWHHMAVVRDGAGDEVEFYLDGVSQGTRSASLSALDVAPGGLVLGEEQDSVGGGFSGSQALDGALDEVHFFGKLLTAQEVADLAQAPPDTTPPSAPSGLTASASGLDVTLDWAPAADAESGIAGYNVYRGTGGAKSLLDQVAGSATSYVDSATVVDTTYYYEVTATNGGGLEGPASNEADATTFDPNDPFVGHWKLDETAGTTAADSSLFGNDGTTFGGPTWIAGHIGGGLNFDPANDYLRIPGSVLHGQGDVTVAMWVKADTSGKHSLISGANSGNSNEFLMYYRSNTAMRFYTGQAASSNVEWTTPPLADGAWHHLALVRDDTNDQVELYFDGVSLGVRATTLNPLTIAANGLLFGQEQDRVGGRFSKNQALDGSLDDIRIYTTVLGAAEIEALANP